MKRANRHAMDLRSCSLLSPKGSVYLCEFKPCIMIKGLVQASMKDAMYKIHACFTNEHLISCNCSCKCGGELDKKTVCVHTAAVGVGLSHLLMDGLSKHILVEVANIFGK